MIVIDLDSTLRDVSCANHLIPDDPTKARNWIKWQEYVNEHGTPIPEVFNLVELFSIDEYITLVTSSQFGSEEWLAVHGLSVDYIVERDMDDNRHGFEFKKEFADLNADNIDLWIDDDARVLDYVESLGILTVRVPKMCTGVHETKH